MCLIKLIDNFKTSSPASHEFDIDLLDNSQFILISIHWFAFLHPPTCLIYQAKLARLGNLEPWV